MKNKFKSKNNKKRQKYNYHVMYLKLFIFKFYFIKIVKRIKIGSNAGLIFTYLLDLLFSFWYQKKTCNRRRVRKKKEEK